MTSLGNIYSSYGKSFSVAVANTYSNVVLSSNNLPENTIIIASNVDDNYEDTGSYSLIVTDNNGSPVRLTYTIKLGNGLVEDIDNSDIISLNIDNTTIKSTSYGLSIDLRYLSNDTVFVNENGKLEIDTSKFDVASENVKGILNVDGNTIITNEDSVISVNSENLMLSNNDTGQYGIVSSSDGNFNIENGVISLNESNLPVASNEEYGMVKGDDYTIVVNDDSSLSVNTQNLVQATNENYGITIPDDMKVSSNNGELYVNTTSLSDANSSNVGVISIDNNTIVLNDNNQITIKDNENILNSIEELSYSLNSILDKFNSLKEEILSQINE